ncbi:APC family permease [Fodinibius sp. AD559]|uniref:APC family permease n=1 Tax=Fodinibius sp. AD559 TaxID=3424179 RepID=UPI00404695D5
MGNKESGAKNLERTLSLGAALAIGVGTMVGAGIFVFPGIAAGYAGPAAMVSFAIGGIIALVVAVSTAELATAMPESGGAYFYVSRVYGPLAGFIIGIGQWVGLVFASSFYLSGFGQYAIDLIHRLGFQMGDLVVLVAFGTALLLMIINLLGTKGAGKLQNRVVIILTGLLSLLFGYGLLNAAGIVGETAWPTPFAPNGIGPVFTTTALIFTSYLGFVQIATVAGEIKNPDKNIPRALVGSVLIVAVLYVVALFVSTSVLSAETLSELGETAMVEVARALVGDIGALIVITAGLLATLSSANASILSSSRAIYALSLDDLLPDNISRVNDRFGTPHIALLAVGFPIAGLTMLGRIEVLAEVASLLHLVIYGMICVALMSLRYEKPYWYNPTFKIPAFPVLPIIGALASFGLIFLMEPISQVMGLGILGLALGWYALFVPAKSFSPPLPSVVDQAIINPRIVMPIEIEDPKPVPRALLEAFTDFKLDVLGYQIVPEQTSPEQSREAFEEESHKKFDKVLDQLKGQDIDFQSDTVFTPNFAETLNAFIDENDTQAVLTARPISSVKRLLVPVYTKSQVNSNLVTMLYDLAISSDLPVSLIVMVSGESESDERDTIEALEDYAVQQLELAGLGSDQIRTNRAEVANIAEAVDELAAEDDVVILSEADTSNRDSFFNTIHNDIEDKLDCPLLVVLND